MEVLNRQIYRFEDIEVDPSRRCLRRGGEELEVRQKSLRALLFLLEERHRLVTKEELIDHVWEGMAVTDDALVQLIKEIRRHLADDPRHPRFIKTIPRGGYRFIGTVEEHFCELPTTIEVEHHASVEIEFEEEIIGATEREVEPEARPIVLPTATTASAHRRKILAVALASVLLSAVAFTAYLIRKSRSRPGELADVTLPQVNGRRTLAVMYFENQSGDTESDWLREGLADMLITELSRSQRLSVLGRQQLHLLFERIGHAPESNVRLDEALDVARRVQAETVALGSFTRTDGKIRVDVQLYDARHGQLLTSESLVVEQPGQLLTQVDLLALKLSSYLSAPDDQERNVGLTSVMTNNLQAYRYYSLGVEKANMFLSAEAVALLEKAIALDPEFAMAYARIGYTYALSWGRPDEGQPYLEKAFQLSGRLTEKDRLSITAWYGVAHRDYSTAIETYRQIIARYPLEVEAYWRMARLLRGEERMEESVDAARQGLAVDAESKDLCNMLGGTYREMGRHDEAITTMQRCSELAPGDPNIYDSLGMAYQWAGRYGEAIQAYERALSLNPQFEIAIVHLANTYAWQGRYRDALRQYQRSIQVASFDHIGARSYNSIALLHLKRKEFDEADRAARATVKYDKQYIDPLILLALERDDLATAEKLMAILEQKQLDDRGSRGFERARAFYRGYVALKSGRAPEAIENFKEALRHRPMDWNIDAYEDCLANAYLNFGRFDEAISEYERIRRFNPNYPLLNYYLARAYEGKGDVSRARDEYEKFLKIWETADPDVPEVRDARAKLNL